MNTTPTQSNLSVLLKMEAALNAHDIDALVNGFTRLEQENGFCRKK